MSRFSLGGRGVRAIAALAAVSTFMAGPLAAVAAAAPSTAAGAQQEVPESSTEQKIAAGDQIGLRPDPSKYSLKDCDFVIYLWDKAKLPDDAKVKEAAADAFTTSFEDPASCYRFITEGVFTAHREDIAERMRKAARDRQRIAAAQVVNWTNLAQGDLDCALKEFVFRIWERAEANSEVKTKAAAVLTPTATDEQRTTYITTDIFTARETDRQRKMEEAERAERERQERLKNEQARAHAWQVVARATLTDDLKLITDREFVYELHRRATGKWMKADSQAAADSRDPKVWKDFIFTGVDAAHQKDLEEQNQQDAKQTETRILEILDRAERDGYLPNLVTAARTALAGDLAARHAFLNVGQYEALKRDQIKPANRRVIELQGLGSARCLQLVGVPADAMAPGQLTEVWDCVRGTKQVWELYQYGDDQYLLKSLHSKLCMDAVGDNVVQNACEGAGTTLRWRFIENAADGSFQLQNVATGWFATAKDSGTANGTLVVQGGNSKHPDQRWRIIDPTHRADVVAVNSGVVKVKGVHSERCMQVAGVADQPGAGALADLAEMELWDCAGSAKLTWEVIPLGENKYALKNRTSGKCLDVRNGDYQRGTPWIQFGCHYSGTQQFVFTQSSERTYGLQNALTGQYADVSNASTHNGALIQSWDYTGLTNQRWSLEYVNA